MSEEKNGTTPSAPNEQTHAWVKKEDLQSLINQRNQAGDAANSAHALIRCFRQVFEHFGALMPAGAKSLADINPMDLMETMNKPIPPETIQAMATVQQFMEAAKAADEAEAKSGKVIPLNPGK